MSTNYISRPPVANINALPLATGRLYTGFVRWKASTGEVLFTATTTPIVGDVAYNTSALSDSTATVSSVAADFSSIVVNSITYNKSNTYYCWERVQVDSSGTVTSKSGQIVYTDTPTPYAGTDDEPTYLYLRYTLEGPTEQIDSYNESLNQVTTTQDYTYAVPANVENEIRMTRDDGNSYLWKKNSTSGVYEWSLMDNTITFQQRNIPGNVNNPFSLADHIADEDPHDVYVRHDEFAEMVLEGDMGLILSQHINDANPHGSIYIKANMLTHDYESNINKVPDALQVYNLERELNDPNTGVVASMSNHYSSASTAIDLINVSATDLSKTMSNSFGAVNSRFVSVSESHQNDISSINQEFASIHSSITSVSNIANHGVSHASSAHSRIDDISDSVTANMSSISTVDEKVIALASSVPSIASNLDNIISSNLDAKIEAVDDRVTDVNNTVINNSSALNSSIASVSTIIGNHVNATTEDRNVHPQYSLISHNHDGVYSVIGHTHSDYAAKVHNHDLVYAVINHDHNGVYSFADHNHDDVYAFVDHNHDTKYSDIYHNHDDSYAKIIHNHDESYANINHNHEGVYAISSHNHNDLYSVITHVHDERYALIDHNHDTVYSVIDHNHDTVYALIDHNHDLLYATIDHTHDIYFLNNNVVTDLTGVDEGSDVDSKVASLGVVFNINNTLTSLKGTVDTHIASITTSDEHNVHPQYLRFTDISTDPLGSDYSSTRVPALSIVAGFNDTINAHINATTISQNVHPQYSLVTHTHSGEYANITHTHSEYLTENYLHTNGLGVAIPVKSSTLNEEYRAVETYSDLANITTITEDEYVYVRQIDGSDTGKWYQYQLIEENVYSWNTLDSSVAPSDPTEYQEVESEDDLTSIENIPGTIVHVTSTDTWYICVLDDKYEWVEVADPGITEYNEIDFNTQTTYNIIFITDTHHIINIPENSTGMLSTRVIDGEVTTYTTVNVVQTIEDRDSVFSNTNADIYVVATDTWYHGTKDIESETITWETIEDASSLVPCYTSVPSSSTEQIRQYYTADSGSIHMRSGTIKFNVSNVADEVTGEMTTVSEEYVEWSEWVSIKATSSEDSATVTEHINNTDIHVTTDDKTNWNNKISSINGSTDNDQYFIKSITVNEQVFTASVDNAGNINLGTLSSGGSEGGLSSLTLTINGTEKTTSVGVISFTLDEIGAAPASHVSDTDVHVTTADKERWDNNTGGFDGNYTSLATDTLPTINGVTVTGALTLEALSIQEAKTGYSLVADTEISRLAGVTNYDHTAVDEHMDDKTIHVTEAEKSAWDSKSDFSGSYTELTGIPSINNITITGNVTLETLGVEVAGAAQSVQDILDGHISNTDTNTQHVTATEKNSWNSKIGLINGSSTDNQYLVKTIKFNNTEYTASADNNGVITIEYGGVSNVGTVTIGTSTAKSVESDISFTLAEIGALSTDHNTDTTAHAGLFVKTITNGTTSVSANTDNNGTVDITSLMSGKADLENGKVKTSQLPSYVDDVIEGYMNTDLTAFYSSADLTDESLITGESGKIYVDLSNNKSYRYGTSIYVEISKSVVVGTTSGTAYDGAAGAALATGLATHINETDTSVDKHHHTTAQAAAWDAKLSSINGSTTDNQYFFNSITFDGATYTASSTNNGSIDLGTIPIKSVTIQIGNQSLTSNNGTGLVFTLAEIGAASAEHGTHVDASTCVISVGGKSGNITFTRNSTPITADDSGNISLDHTHGWSSGDITGIPTTVSSFNFTDLSIDTATRTITIGSNTIKVPDVPDASASDEGKILKIIGGKWAIDTASAVPLIKELTSTTFEPEHNTIYTKTIADGDTFVFTTPTSNTSISFRLYLTYTGYSPTWPSNILWEDDTAPEFLVSNALYMIVFEWNPVLSKWLGNQMWLPVTLS